MKALNITSALLIVIGISITIAFPFFILGWVVIYFILSDDKMYKDNSRVTTGIYKGINERKLSTYFLNKYGVGKIIYVTDFHEDDTIDAEVLNDKIIYYCVYKDYIKVEVE